MGTGLSPRIVNYAFLQELKAENTPLWDDVVLLGSYCEEPFSTDWIEQNAGNLLRSLREKLSGQFRMEEGLAYIPAPGAVQSDEVTLALNQHFKIRVLCVTLSEQCDDFEYAGNLGSETHAIWLQMRELHAAILEHESLELKLIPRDYFNFNGDTESSYELHSQTKSLIPK